MSFWLNDKDRPKPKPEVFERRPDPEWRLAMKQLREKLERSLREAEAALSRFKGICAHPNHTRTAGSNTGNYDPSADSYWYDFECSDCGHRWTTPQ